MPITCVFVPEKSEQWEEEPCCFCREPTSFWVRLPDMKESVACCEECGERAHPDDVPSKALWFRRERIADHSARSINWRSPGNQKRRACDE